MSKPYDAATKRLVELRPEDWVAFLGLPSGPVSLVDADLSTISAAADRLIRVDAEVPYIMHNEMESGHDTARAPDRCLRYNVVAEYKLELPVVSTIFALRRESDSPALTGRLVKMTPNSKPYLTFEYGVVRVWQMDVESILQGGLGTLPFAPISHVRQADLPGIIRQMESRIDSEANSDIEAGELWTATYVLMGLRYDRAFNAELLKGVRRMKESNTYQAILEEGRQEGELIEAQRMLLRAGRNRLGQPSEVVEAAVLRIGSRERLELLVDRLFGVETWEELLQEETGG